MAALVIYGCSSSKSNVKQADTPGKPGIEEPMDEESLEIKEGAERLVEKRTRYEAPAPMPSNVKVERVRRNDDKGLLTLDFSKAFAEVPFREENVGLIYSEVLENLPEEYRSYKLNIRALNKNIEDLIPNYYRKDSAKLDYSRIPKDRSRTDEPLVKNASKPYVPENGLYNRNIALWHSHGWYYNNQLKRWEWQRARLFQTVEDKLTLSFSLQYITKMLENAGAYVFIPRERDVQTNEVIIDNDFTPDSSLYIESGAWQISSKLGYNGRLKILKGNENPFKAGTSRITPTSNAEAASAAYIPYIPETGEYAVYVSYTSHPNSVSSVTYTVYHLGGVTEFKINQKMGGGTWIYLDKFKFAKGLDSLRGSVVVSNMDGQPGSIVSTDAVKFGGGMGMVERGGAVSGRPKYLEGSRYYLQSSGIPDTIVYSMNADTNDYVDDYQSRGEYVNYLMGYPNAPRKDTLIPGLKIPIDASLALHTDAGITFNDTTIGTLLIYSLKSSFNKLNYANGVSRYANRDLADILQTQIVEDIKSKYDSAWSRRQLREADYSESVRPNVPSVLIELLSHQNFLDMKFANDPNFRFDVSRSMYKGVLKFLSMQYGFKPVVQPLPVTNFSAEFAGDEGVLLKWKGVSDPLEPTAAPDKYIVYTRIGAGGFDNGVVTDNEEIRLNGIVQDSIYSFKVAALNSGGESFPSEILSVCRTSNSIDTVMIVNGFDRISAPASIEEYDFAGFLNRLDEGSPYMYDMSLTGEQYDYNPVSKWITNDLPGFGASGAEYEKQLIAGNSFDYPYTHGMSVRNAGYSFVSCSDESVIDFGTNIDRYRFVDLILGEEKSTPHQRAYMDSAYGVRYKTFPKELQDAVAAYLLKGGNLFVSGAYIATDLFNSGQSGIDFARNILKYELGSQKASINGKVYAIDTLFFPSGKELEFCSYFNDKIYKVESPDGLMPVQGAKTIFRYSVNGFSAGTAYKDKYGVVALGFPFETILTQAGRDALMLRALNFLKKEAPPPVKAASRKK